MILINQGFPRGEYKLGMVISPKNCKVAGSANELDTFRSCNAANETSAKQGSYSRTTDG